MFFVYILESLKDGGWYIGYTSDLNQRLKHHSAGKSIATRNRRPLKLIYAEVYIDSRDARGREVFLKSGGGRRFLKKQLSHYLSETCPPTT